MQQVKVALAFSAVTVNGIGERHGRTQARSAELTLKTEETVIAGTDFQQHVLSA